MFEDQISCKSRVTPNLLALEKVGLSWTSDDSRGLNKCISELFETLMAIHQSRIQYSSLLKQVSRLNKNSDGLKDVAGTEAPFPLLLIFRDHQSPDFHEHNISPLLVTKPIFFSRFASNSTRFTSYKITANIKWYNGLALQCHIYALLSTAHFQSRFAVIINRRLMKESVELRVYVWQPVIRWARS
jgi:hypothetical protein